MSLVDGNRGSSAIVVNGVDREVPRDPERSLLHVLREELGLTGAKYGCGEGACGSCTVLLDGVAAQSCMTTLSGVGGRRVTTPEGLSGGRALHPVARAFLEEGAIQCGYCTPGMVLAAAALLEETPSPDDERIALALEGNVCRCGVYPRILRAVRRAAERAADGSDEVDVPPASAPQPELRRPRAPWDLTPPEERDYFPVLGDGLVVVLVCEDDGGEGWATTRDAWIHVAADGAVTAFVGKVDVGQDNRAALRTLVAAELRVALDDVRVVMGDTDVCPFDIGTFGSRSTVDAGAALRAAAASARRVLDSSGLPAAGERRVEVARTSVFPDPADVGGVAPRMRRSVETVTGARRFATDLTRRGLRHGALLRPPSAGARLRSLAVGDAESLPGVNVVREEGFVGIVAPDPIAARRGVDALQAEWDPSPPQPSDATLVEHLRSHPVEEEGWNGMFRDEAGDVGSALANADVVLDRTYTTAYIAHVPLETRVALAEWEADRLTVFTTTQRPFAVRREVAAALGVPEVAVRIVVPDAGGAFGGKHSGEVAIEAARLARAVGAPVKVRWSRDEEFRSAYFRPAAVIDVRSGIRDGELVAWEFTNINAGAAGIETPYDVADRSVVYRPATSPIRQGSYRGLAATANHFARESHMDEIAHAIGEDPLKLRLRHLASERLAAVLRAAADRADWRARRPRGRGIGIAGGTEKDAYVATVAEVHVDDDERLEILRLVTAFDCGAIVDRDNLLNQIEGATVMGLGGALTEAIRFSNGVIWDACLSRYPVPRFSDVPPIDVVLLQRPDVPSAGAGETPIVCVAPAIANAIFAARGVRLRSMPLTPDGVVPLNG
jgi:isoquinoline 1-oxidoreductase